MTESSQIDLTNVASPPNYQINGYLGDGAMGCVYKAFHLNLEKEVALKTCPINTNDPMQNSDRLLQEARTVARLDHPHIVRVTDCFIWNDQIYIAMEYLKGDTLGDLLVKRVEDLPKNSLFRSWMPADGKLNPEQAVMIIDKLAQALEFAHAKEIYHRDLKPTNIFILDDGTVKLIDFSIASDQKQGMTRTGVVVGSPPYMSPEQIRGEKVDGRCDIYSLGCVLFHCITGTAPFYDTSEIMICIKHLNVAPPDPKELEQSCSDKLRNIILKCLEKSKKKRYANMRELREDLATLGYVMTQDDHLTTSTTTPLPILQESVSTEAMPIPQEPVSYKGVKKLMLALTAVTALALLAIGYFLYISPPPDTITEPNNDVTPGNQVVIDSNAQIDSLETNPASPPKEDPGQPGANETATVSSNKVIPPTPVVAKETPPPPEDPKWLKLQELQKQANESGTITEGVVADSMMLITEPTWSINLTVRNTNDKPVEIFGMIKEASCTFDCLYTGQEWQIKETPLSLGGVSFGQLEEDDDPIILQANSTSVFPISISPLSTETASIPLYANVSINDLRLVARKVDIIDLDNFSGEFRPELGQADIYTTDTIVTEVNALKTNRAQTALIFKKDMLSQDDMHEKAGNYLDSFHKVEKSHPDLNFLSPPLATTSFIKFLTAARKAQENGLIIPLNQYGCNNISVETSGFKAGYVQVDDFTVYLQGARVIVSGYILDGYQTMTINTGTEIIEVTRSLQGQMLHEILPYTEDGKKLTLTVGGAPIATEGSRFVEHKELKINQMLLFLQYNPKRPPRSLNPEKRPEISFKCLKTD